MEGSLTERGGVPPPWICRSRAALNYYNGAGQKSTVAHTIRLSGVALAHKITQKELTDAK